VSTDQKKSARETRIAQFADSAARWFKDHEVEVLLDQGLFRCWRCAKKGDSAYAFMVTTIPGRIIVVGDIGEIIVERTSDMIPWCRSSINSIDYFEEKVPNSIKTVEYDSEVAREWVESEIAIQQGLLAEEDGDEYPDENAIAEISNIMEQYRDLLPLVDEEHRFIQELYDSGLIDGCDWPDLTNYNANFLWCREAIKWRCSSSGPASRNRQLSRSHKALE